MIMYSDNSQPLIVALDGMGGDKAPESVVRGAARIAKKSDNINFLIFGNEQPIKQQIENYSILNNRISIIHSDETISDDEKPSAALRRKGTSMRLAIEAVRDGKAHCIVSSGNTGALMALSMFILTRMPGIERPAIACFCPTIHGNVCLLDVGANVTADARNLVDFSIMGKLFYQVFFDKPNPRIALLNIGEEEVKGNDNVKRAAHLLRESSGEFNYVGFVEGNFMMYDNSDVIVTDGFSGNILLKTAEGSAKLYGHFVRTAFYSSIMAKIGYIFARQQIEKLRQRLDPRNYNGAMILGLNGICVKSHGSADAIGFANAIEVAVNLVQKGFIEKMSEDLEKCDFSLLDSNT